MRTIFSFSIVLVLLIQACTIESKPKQFTLDQETINNLIETWHQAATDADFDTYFACMTESSYFIGTDASEKWNTNEFKAFCKPIFDRGSAWEFKTIKRQIFISEQGDVAWFDEQLDTWMGVCMSSGVVVRTDEGWKIEHYQLSIAVPNDVVDDFISLVKKYEENKVNEKE
ncbi:MAG: hypothetical protein CL663_05685 [Bacteroidetes bacterium]|nr:hypothetical protein [Bacteroidota bacterium]